VLRQAGQGDEPVLLRDERSGEPLAVLLPIGLYGALTGNSTEDADLDLPDAEVETLSKSPKVAAILEHARRSGHVDAETAWKDLGLIDRRR
jgi:hypothetical protein